MKNLVTRRRASRYPTICTKYKRKEFFAVSAEEINVFFDIVEGKASASEHAEERQQWEEALAKAGK